MRATIVLDTDYPGAEYADEARRDGVTYRLVEANDGRAVYAAEVDRKEWPDDLDAYLALRDSDHARVVGPYRPGDRCRLFLCRATVDVRYIGAAAVIAADVDGLELRAGDDTRAYADEPQAIQAGETFDPDR